MSDYGVKVTFSGPILFLASGQWTHTFTSLKERLPLRNLHWRSVSRPSVRSVQELDVELVSLESVRDEPSSQIPTTLLERPLLNIYFVTCEVSQSAGHGQLRPANMTPLAPAYRMQTRTKTASGNRYVTGTLQSPNERTKSGSFVLSSALTRRGPPRDCSNEGQCSTRLERTSMYRREKGA